MTPAQSSSPALPFLLPSVRDIVFVFLFWALLVGPLSNRPLADADIGWHIRTGELILATHSFPRTDPFSSTMQGQPWFAWEWLYDIGLGILHRVSGLNGVVWLGALQIATVFTLLLAQLLLRGTGLALAIVLMLLAESAATIHMYARPHLVSWLFSLLWFVALERWEHCSRRGDGQLPRWIPWFFPASMLLWANLHGGWLFGMALLGLYAFAAFVESARAKDPFAAIAIGRRARRMLGAWLVAAMATLVNPFGWRLHEHIYRYLSNSYLMNRIDEFRSPDFHGWAQRCFAVILGLTLIAFASQLSGIHKKLPLSNLLVVLMSTYAGLYSTRNLPLSSTLLVLIVGPILWETFTSLAEKRGAWQLIRNGTRRISSFSDRMAAMEMNLRGRLWPIVTAALALAICLHGGWLGSERLIHAQFDPRRMPAAAVTFLEEEFRGGQLGGKTVFSTDAWGGYLVYRLYPEPKVVVDDRHDLYGSGRIRQYVILTQGEPGWQEVLKDWQIRTVLLPTDSTLANLLRELPQDWRVDYEDKVGVVFEKR